MNVPRLDFRALGAVEVRSNDQILPLGGALQTGLLSVLLLHANRTVSADRVADLLWNGDPPKSARAGIQGRVSKLRRLLGGSDRLSFRPPGYVLRIENDEFDVDEFIRQADQGARALRAGDLTRAEAALDSAAALWAGEPYADVPLLACGDAVAQLEARRLLAVEDRLDVALRLGRHGEVLGELAVLVRANPLRERLRRLQMLAMYRSGGPADALGAYGDLRERLHDELGLDPDPETQQLELAILRRDPDLTLPQAGPSPSPASPAQPRPAQLPLDIATFVGRTDVLDRLAERAAAAVDAAAVTVITGMPGVGKPNPAM